MYNGTSRLFIDQEPLLLPLQMQYTGEKTKWNYQDVDDHDHLEDDDDHVDEDLEGIEAALGGNLASDRILRRAIQIQIRIPTRYRQTWDLSKNLHDRIFGSKILIFNFNF